SLEEIFREVHSIKGDSNALGFNKVGQAAHTMETFMSELQKNPEQYNKQALEKMFSYINLIRDIVDNLIKNQSDIKAEIIKNTISIEEQEPENTDISDEIKELYAVEVVEHINNINNILFDLESEKSELKISLEEIFREVHSIKGDSNALGFNKVGQAAHTMETFMSELQKNPEQYNKDILSKMFNYIGSIKNIVDSLNTKKEKGSNKKDTQLTTQNTILSSFVKNITLNMPVSKLTIMDNKAKLFDGQDMTYPQYLRDIEDNKINQFETQNTNPQKDNKKELIKEVNKVPIKSEKVDDETIRVSTHKIDKLINLSDELLISKISYEQRLTELKDLLDSLQGYKNNIKATLKNSSSQLIDAQTLFNMGNSFVDNLTNLEDKVNHNFRELRKDNNHFSFVVDEIQYDSRNTRMIPASVLIGPLKIVARNTAKKLNKEIKLSVFGEEIEIDRVIAEKLKDPIAHILRNAIDHGLETTEERLAKNKSEKSNVSIELSIYGNNIVFKISDDGRGIDYSRIKKKALNMGLITDDQATYISDYELNQILLAPGFSTAEKITDISGRGVGLDVVKSSIEDLNGQITINSVFGVGTTFILTLPVTLTTFDAFLIDVNDVTYAIPKSVIISTINIKKNELINNGSNSAIKFENKPIKLISLGQALELEDEISQEEKSELVVLIVEIGVNRLAFSINQVIETRRMVMKNLGSQLQKVKNISGATILGNGEPVIVLNMNDIFNASFSEMSNIKIHNHNKNKTEKTKAKKGKRVLVVDDSVTTRTLEKNILENAGFEVIIAKDGLEGKEMALLHNPDLIITDVEMPKMNGYQFANWLKKESELYTIPVIMISSLSSPEQKEKAYSTGINSYIVKGEFNQKKLLDTIDELL
ncbi:MAG: response regulator, partial [Candidatus Sericytochromatia bacterium]|nr:response regulator [Candidatus Sericytochromatia bacterium]